jgi:hypothetical protein
MGTGSAVGLVAGVWEEEVPLGVTHHNNLQRESRNHCEKQISPSA